MYSNVNPGKDHWLSAGSGLSSCPYTMIFSTKEVRVHVEMTRASKEENKFIFDALHAQREALEASFGHSLDWLRMDDKKASRIQFSHAVEGFDKANWPEMIEWLVKHLTLLEAAFKQPLQGVGRELKRNFV